MSPLEFTKDRDAVPGSRRKEHDGIPWREKPNRASFVAVVRQPARQNTDPLAFGGAAMVLSRRQVLLRARRPCYLTAPRS